MLCENCGSTQGVRDCGSTQGVQDFCFLSERQLRQFNADNPMWGKTTVSLCNACMGKADTLLNTSRELREQLFTSVYEPLGGDKEEARAIFLQCLKSGVDLFDIGVAG